MEETEHFHEIRDRQTTTEVLHLADKWYGYTGYLELCKHAQLLKNCNVSYQKC